MDGINKRGVNRGYNFHKLASRLAASAILILFFINSLRADEEYLLGNGDVVRITVYGQQDLATVARINEVNKINFPLIGEIEIGVLTARQAESKIAKALEKGGFVRSPQVTIGVEQYRSRQISILGQVNRPGKISIDGPSTVVDIIALAGGITREGGDVANLIRVDANRETTYRFIDLYALLQRGDLKQNLELKNGDIIYVPPMDRFYIYGEVQRPGTYRLERNMTVMQALAIGGGITPKGTERGILVKRRNGKGDVGEVKVDLTSVLAADDVVYVKESLF